MCLWWIGIGLFPSQIPVTQVGRNMIDLNTSFPVPYFNFADPMVLTAIMIGCLLGLFLVRRRGAAREAFRFSWVWWVGAALAIFVLFLAVGRANPRGLQITIFNNLYYTYFFWLMFIAIIYALLRNVIFPKAISLAAVVLVGILIVHNGQILYRRNQIQAQEANPTLLLIRTLDLLIAERGQEPDFSFYVSPDYPGNFKCHNVKKSADPRDVYSMMEILYPRHFVNKKAKYNFLATTDI
jgi:hypothetical protein